MLTINRLFVAIFAVLVFAGICNTAVSAQALPDHVAKITEGVYSYGPGDHYFSMFVVTSEGVIATESVNTEHAAGLLQAIREVTDQPVKYMPAQPQSLGSRQRRSGLQGCRSNNPGPCRGL